MTAAKQLHLTLLNPDKAKTFMQNQFLASFLCGRDPTRNGVEGANDGTRDLIQTRGDPRDFLFEQHPILKHFQN